MSPIETIVNIVALGIFLLYWTITFIIFYHLTRFGIGVQPKRLAVVFLFGSLVLSFATLILFTNLDIGNLVTGISLTQQ